jgi:hypothetical protein
VALVINRYLVSTQEISGPGLQERLRLFMSQNLYNRKVHSVIAFGVVTPMRGLNFPKFG